MLYFDEELNQRHNERTLTRQGKFPSHPSIKPLYMDEPEYDNNTQVIRDTGDVEPYLDGYNIKYEVSELLLENAQSRLLNKLEKVRFEKETGGITLEDGTEIQTDIQSQSKTDAAYNALKNTFITETDWKGPSGWTTVTETELKPIAQAIAVHVKNCFKAERLVDDMINSKTSTSELVDFDVSEFENQFNSL